MFSSFEGGRLTDGQGESLYAQTRITDQDSPLISDMIDRAVEQLNGQFSSTLGEVALKNDMGNTEAEESTGTQKVVEELVATNVMARWLEDKSKERSESYARMYSQMAHALRTKLKPTLMEDY